MSLINLIVVSLLLVQVSSCTCDRVSKENRTQLSEAEKQGKKIFYMPRYNAFRSLDPMRQFDEASTAILQNVYDRLLEYHYLKRPYEMMPALLEKLPEKQSDGLSYVFELRKGVYFIDDECFPRGKGRELVADDVIYTLKRFADANVNALSYSLMAGFIEGMDAYRETSKRLGESFRYDDHEIKGLQKLGKYNFKIVFTKDNPVALFPFSMSPLSIIPREAVEKYGQEFERHPVGTGPFYMAKMDRRGDLVLKKNTRYWGKYPNEGEASDKSEGLLEDAGRNLPLIDEVRMPLIEEAQPAILSFQKGDIDLVRIDRDSFGKFMELKGDKIGLREQYRKLWKMYWAPGLNLDYLRFNMKDPVVGGTGEAAKALRKAIAYALDIPGFVDLIYGGRARELRTLIPHPIWGSEEFTKNNSYSYDPEQAKLYLAAAGYPNGEGLPELTVEYRSAAPLTRQQWEYHRSKLADVGIRAKANFQTFSSFLKKTDSGNFQISAGGWMADYPDPENFFSILYGPNKSPGPNHGFYSNDDYDRLFDQMRFMVNSPERLKLIEQLNEIIYDELPLVPLYSVKRVGMFHRWVRNVKRNVLIHPPLKYVDIDREIKAKGL